MCHVFAAHVAHVARTPVERTAKDNLLPPYRAPLLYCDKSLTDYRLPIKKSVLLTEIPDNALDSQLTDSRQNPYDNLLSLIHI